VIMVGFMKEVHMLEKMNQCTTWIHPKPNDKLSLSLSLSLSLTLCVCVCVCVFGALRISDIFMSCLWMILAC
jgi:hypothetical protein